MGHSLNIMVSQLNMQISRQQAAPIRIVTDKLHSYSAAMKELLPNVGHSTKQYENNRCELFHQRSRQQERQMKKFKSQEYPQRFLSCHGVVNNLFRLSRHLMKANNYILILDRAFVEWNRVSYFQNLA
jgi:putative transposase